MARDGQGRIEVCARPGDLHGELRFAGRVFVCALGRSGIVTAKREGDGATPQGRFPLRELRYRADRISRPTTALEVLPIATTDGWCDDPFDPAYNRLVTLPHRARAEALSRDDGLYDALVVIGYNDAPVIPGAGSAIFLHVAEGSVGALQPTAGCVALTLDALRQVLAGCGPATEIDIAFP